MCGLFSMLLIIMAKCEAGTLVFWLCFCLSAPASKWEWWKAAGERGEAVGESVREKKNNCWIVESVRNKEVSRYWCVRGWRWLWSLPAPAQVRAKCNVFFFFFYLSLSLFLDHKEKDETEGCGGVFAVYFSLSLSVSVWLCICFSSPFCERKCIWKENWRKTWLRFKSDVLDVNLMKP